MNSGGGMSYYPNGQGMANNLNRDSQTYHPSGYDMQGQYPRDWNANNTRSLNGHSAVFIPGPQANGVNAQNHPGYNQPARRNPGPPVEMTPQQQMAMMRQGGMGQPVPMMGRPIPGPPPGYRMAMNMQDPSVMMHGGVGGYPQDQNQLQIEKICQLILNLRDPKKKYDACKSLSEMRENFDGLAIYLWYSPGTISALLQEIISIYPYLSPPTLTKSHSDRICHVLGLFQCLVLNDTTKPLFMQADLHIYLFPLINKQIKQVPYDQLRVSSLGVIGALVKVKDTTTIQTLVGTEIIALCLKIMKKGTQLSRIVSTYIVQKILSDEQGLEFICNTDDRLLALSQILHDIIEDFTQLPNPALDKENQRLLRHVLGCYQSLAGNPKTHEHLTARLPETLKNPNTPIIAPDQTQMRKTHQQLLATLRLSK